MGGTSSPNHPGNTTKICPVCGKEFGTYNRGRIYCSHACQAKKRRQNIGISEREWVWLREFIMERDNYTCQDCGIFLMDLGLEVHHIKPVIKGGGNKETNLVSLCHKCHARRHRTLYV